MHGFVLRWSIVAVALVAAVGLFLSASHHGRESLQMDFAAFWVAGSAQNHGLSPYVNHVDRDPPLWDGVATYRHSRFLYPPLVADLFRPLAAFSYGAAKRLWMGIAFGALVAALALAWRVRRDLDFVSASALAVATAALFFPTRALLERGQIDSLPLLALVGAWMLRKRSPWGGGALLAVATLLKLHCVLVLPFLVLTRSWRTLRGAAAGAIVLLGVGLTVDGTAAWTRYAYEELPRIARYGEGGARTDRLPQQAFARVMSGVPRGRVAMDGRTYQRQTLDFVLNASAVRTPIGRFVYDTLRSTGAPIAPGHVSLALIAVTFVGAVLLVRSLGRPPDDIGGALMLTVVLLAAPVTWAMGVVWLLAVLPVVIPWPAGPARIGATAATVGIVVAALPDAALARVLGTTLEGVLKYEYVLVESIVLVGLVTMWWAGPRRRGDDS